MYRSRLPKIAAELHVRADISAKAAAELIAAKAKEKVHVRTGHLRDAIHVEDIGDGEYLVQAGNEKVFYGHIVEHGGAHTPPHPFLIPAAEESQKEIQTLGKEAFRDL